MPGVPKPDSVYLEQQPLHPEAAKIDVLVDLYNRLVADGNFKQAIAGLGYNRLHLIRILWGQDDRHRNQRAIARIRCWLDQGDLEALDKANPPPVVPSSSNCWVGLEPLPEDGDWTSTRCRRCIGLIPHKTDEPPICATCGWTGATLTQIVEARSHAA